MCFRKKNNKYNLLIVFFFSFFLQFQMTQAKVVEHIELKRLISLKPNITQNLVALGLSDRIVGVTKFCDKPNESAVVVGDYNSIDVEAVIRLKPDLVISSEENSQSQQYEALLAAGIPVRILSFKNYTEFEASWLELAKLFQRESEAEQKFADIKRRIESLQVLYTPSNGIKKSFVVVVQRQPLMVATRNTFLSSVLEKVGLVNNFAANQIDYPTVDEEEFIRELSDYSYEVAYDLNDIATETFLNKTLIRIPIHNVHASIQGMKYILDVLEKYQQPPHDPIH